MKRVILAILLFGFPQTEQMTVPKVEHMKRVETNVYDDVTVICPEGYEGHFVDTRKGFDFSYWDGGYGGFQFTPELGYTVCFSKKFMDEVRKNPDLLRQRPAPPRPI